MVDLNRALATAIKTGKVSFGASVALNGAVTGKVRLIVVATNCPEETRDKLEHYCKLSAITLVTYPKPSLDLGRACGKPFSVTALSIRDPGDSDILTIAEEKNV